MIRHKRWLFFLLTLLAGLYILAPLHDFQYQLSTGDHGRELYSFKKALDGALPYRDYSWLYGPFLLYYYALCYQLFGLSVQSILWGQNLLILSVGLLVYLTASLFMAPSLSMACALWYWAFRGTEFFYSYHNIGGVAAILFILYLTFRYIKTSAFKNVFYGFLSLTVLLLIRLNMGLAIGLAYVSSLLMIDHVNKDIQRKKKASLYALLSMAALVISGLVYWALIHPLPPYVIDQTFPYTHDQLAAEKIGPLETMVTFYIMLLEKIPSPVSRFIFGAGAFLSLMQIMVLHIRGKLSAPLKTQLTLVLPVLLLFFLFSLHEFIGSGVWFRFNWAFPVLLLLLFFLLHFLIELNPLPDLKDTFRYGLFFILAIGVSVKVLDIHHDIKKVKSLGQPIQAGRTRLYTVQSSEWIQTVNQASQYLRTNVPPDEKIFTFPHDSLYNFLSQRDNATRQLALFAHTGIPEEQERAIIADLEHQHVNWVVESNRSRSKEFGMGAFGETHCRMIADYIKTNFELVAQMGEWTRPGGWAWDHGVRIWKRKSSP
ncbi:MAG TPA: hypothetical protein PKU74_06735 [Candidatus Omnitrophota bacterium]|nr:hypothetical protein [Candidatus Omnitrophota bacterium]